MRRFALASRALVAAAAVAVPGGGIPGVGVVDGPSPVAAAVGSLLLAAGGCAAFSRLPTATLRPTGWGGTALLLPSQGCGLSRSTILEARRHRFYRPLVNQGINLWRARMGRHHRGWQTYDYQHTKRDPRPYPESSVNDYFGRTRLWNPIAGKIGFVNRKAEEWGWPHKLPPPTGLRHSPEYFPHFFGRYFPDVEVRLMLDTVLNTETTSPVFHVPSEMSKAEIHNYLKNIYHIDNIVSIRTHNVRGRRFKNEVGAIKTVTEDYKVAVVRLDSPVTVEFKQIKGTEDTPDNKPQARLA